MTKHTHKYIRVRVGKNKRYMWKCSIEGCPHSLRYVELLIGRTSICNRCGKEFIITKELAPLAKPHCKSCTASTKQTKIDKLKELLERVS